MKQNARRFAIPLWKSIAFVVLAGSTAALCLGERDMNFSSEAGVRLELPAVLGGFYGESQEMSEAERVILPLDTGFARRVYTDFENNEINCQIVLSSSDKSSIHRPEICLPGQGWSIQLGKVLPVPLNDGRTLEVMHLVLGRPVQVGPEESRMMLSHFFYWFVGNDRITARHYERILLTSYDRIRHNINHRWGYVVVSAPVTEGFRPNGKSSDEVLAALQDFVRQIVPAITEPAALDSL